MLNILTVRAQCLATYLLHQCPNLCISKGNHWCLHGSSGDVSQTCHHRPSQISSPTLLGSTPMLEQPTGLAAVLRVLEGSRYFRLAL